MGRSWLCRWLKDEWPFSARKCVSCLRRNRLTRDVGNYKKEMQLWTLKIPSQGVPWWLSGLWIWYYHCCGCGCCYGAGLIFGLGTSMCLRHGQKPKIKNKTKKKKNQNAGSGVWQIVGMKGRTQWELRHMEPRKWKFGLNRPYWGRRGRRINMGWCGAESDAGLRRGSVGSHGQMGLRSSRNPRKFMMGKFSSLVTDWI